MKKVLFLSMFMALTLASCVKDNIQPSTQNTPASDAATERVSVQNFVTFQEVDPLNVCALSVTVRNYYTNALVYSGSISTYLPYTFYFATATDAEYKINISITPWYPNYNGKKFRLNLQKKKTGFPDCSQGPGPGIATPFSGSYFATGDSWEQCYY